MRKPVCAICEQQRRRSACASAQSDQRLCFRCLVSIIPLVSISEMSSPTSFCGCAGRFVSDMYLVANLEDRFSRGEAHLF